MIKILTESEMNLFWIIYNFVILLRLVWEFLIISTAPSTKLDRVKNQQQQLLRNESRVPYRLRPVNACKKFRLQTRHLIERCYSAKASASVEDVILTDATLIDTKA